MNKILTSGVVGWAGAGVLLGRRKYYLRSGDCRREGNGKKSPAEAGLFCLRARIAGASWPQMNGATCSIALTQ